MSKVSKNCDESTKTTMLWLQIIAILVILIAFIFSFTLFSTLDVESENYYLNLTVVLLMITVGAVLLGFAYSERFNKRIKERCEKQ